MYHGIGVIFRRLIRMQMLRQTGGTWCSDRTRLDLDVAGAYEAEFVFVGVDRHCAGVVGLMGGTPNRVAEKAGGGGTSSRNKGGQWVLLSKCHRMK